MAPDQSHSAVRDMAGGSANARPAAHAAEFVTGAESGEAKNDE